jgi:ribose-phosphate pyrophosphokinase
LPWHHAALRPSPDDLCRPAGGNVHSELTIFTGNANPSLAATIARELNAQLGSCVIDQYPDGDVAVQLLDSVPRKEVFLVQPTSPPVNRSRNDCRVPA